MMPKLSPREADRAAMREMLDKDGCIAALNRVAEGAAETFRNREGWHLGGAEQRLRNALLDTLVYEARLSGWRA